MPSKRAPVSIDEWRKARDPEIQRERIQALVDRLIPDAPGKERWEQRLFLKLTCDLLATFDIKVIEEVVDDRRRQELISVI